MRSCILTLISLQGAHSIWVTNHIEQPVYQEMHLYVEQTQKLLMVESGTSLLSKQTFNIEYCREEKGLEFNMDALAAKIKFDEQVVRVKRSWFFPTTKILYTLRKSPANINRRYARAVLCGMHV